jgi:hypothetical protein
MIFARRALLHAFRPPEMHGEGRERRRFAILSFAPRTASIAYSDRDDN